MFSRYSLFLVPPALALALSSCQLSDNAQKSAENSGLAADNSSKLLDLSNNAYGDGRQGAARDRREKALEYMIHEAKSLTSKSTAASAYLGALEYQLYKDKGFREDDQAKRDSLIKDAVIEVLRTFHDFTTVDWSDAETAKSMQAYIGKWTGESMADHSNATNPLNALAMAASLHKVSDRQIEAAKRYNFPVKSVLDVFAEIMSYKKAAETDPSKAAQLPPYVYAALGLVDAKTHEPFINQILELRLNIMMFSAASNLVGSASASKEGALTVNTNAVLLQDAVDKLKAALQVKSILSKADITPHTFADAKGGLAKFVADTTTVMTAAKDSEANPLTPKLLEAREIAELLVQ